MKIRLNGALLGELNWYGMGELEASVPNHVDEFMLVAYNMYDFGEAMMLWQNNDNGSTYYLDTAEITQAEREAGKVSPQLADGIRDYYKRLAEATL